MGKHNIQLIDACKRLSSGKSIAANAVSSIGRYPVYGGNGLRGYTESKNFCGECAIIGRQGAYCGNVRYFSGEAYMTEHAVVLEVNPEHDTQYLAYLLSTQNLGRLSKQSAQPGLSVQTLGKQIISVHSLDEQRAIASVLSILDKKIALNEALNHNLAPRLAA